MSGDTPRTDERWEEARALLADAVRMADKSQPVWLDDHDLTPYEALEQADSLRAEVERLRAALEAEENRRNDTEMERDAVLAALQGLELYLHNGARPHPCTRRALTTQEDPMLRADGSRREVKGAWMP